MNSFNHYAYGSVVGWLYDTVAGLAPDPSGAGWKTLTIAPTPGGGLTHARATLETPYGRALSAWKIAAGKTEFEIVVPPNTNARVALPASDAALVTEGGVALRDVREATAVTVREGRVTFTLAPGAYHFATTTR
jgi:alpha-L-rhamnosidase